MSFHETRFPTDISKGAIGGPERMTDIVELRSGAEERNAIWADSRRRYDASLGIRSVNDLYRVIEFFEARQGRLYAFRWKDWADYRSGPPAGADVLQRLADGTGATADFQLRKHYTDGGQTYTRDIKKPVAGTVKVYIGGTEETSGWTVDTTTGIITFDPWPIDGARLEASFEFDVPVRFVNDRINVSVDAPEAGSVPAIDLIEVRV